MSRTCSVFVKLPHGLVLEEGFGIAMDAKTPAADVPRVILQHGWNEGVDRARMEVWLKTHAQLAAVRRGDVRIIEDDRLARDSSHRN